MHHLVVVAHPDDESLYFSGLLLKRSKLNWKVICVTDGNADGMGPKRWRQFRAACKKLNAECEILKHPDIYNQRLDIKRLIKELQQLPQPRSVFTHGIIGEYGHPHHQDVSAAVHEAFYESSNNTSRIQVPVWSVAYNCFPDLVIKLDQKQFKTKTEILGKIYRSETRRFAHILPATATEGFVQVDIKEVRALYQYFTHQKRPQLRTLKTFGWYWPYLKDWKTGIPPRLF